MAQMRRQAAKVHEADVGRLSATGAAVMLGISNMKKRKVRTTLTTITLILLTFTVMSFTSVKQETIYNQIPQSQKAAYTGLLLRDRTWFAVEQMALDQFRRQFESKGEVVPRGWISSTDTNNAVNYNFVIYGDNNTQADCQGLVGMMPAEEQALGLGKLLVAGRWFRSADERSIVLPSRVAWDMLKLRKEQVEAGTVRVRVRGYDLAVVGVLDSGRIEQVRDLDDESFTPLDMTSKSNFGDRITSGQFSGNLTEIVKLNHVAVDAAAVVPYETSRRMGARIVSAAVIFPEGYDFVPDLKEFLGRVGMTIFSGRDGRVEAYSSIALSSVGDVGNLFVPILIAALIILNTMMGSVHERAREIAIYSSVGLAPVHIAALFLAESCVYAVMGAIAGYLLGTVVGKAVSVLGIAGLTLNYSSLSAVFSTLVVMGTVLLSTLYPAKMAANMSVPDVTRRWKFPPPSGDLWQFDFPFTVASDGVLGLFVFLDNYFDGYKEASIGSFYAQNVSLYEVYASQVTGPWRTASQVPGPKSQVLEKGPTETPVVSSSTCDLRPATCDASHQFTGYVVELDCWLAPFDLSVSQNVQLRALPTEDAGISRIEMVIRRLSGEDANWRRLNRGFLTLMRKQFLIWRTIPRTTKEDYIREGEERLAARKTSS
jgi:ABC-type antimicrobial peptide transport system permease subunit